MTHEKERAMEMVTRFPGGARVDTEFGPYLVRMDQPLTLGGLGLYPTPFEIFLASIGACAGTYVLAFCRQRDLPTADLRIVKSWERDPATKLVRRIHVEIHVPESFPVKYHSALIRAAEQCTVKKHLQRAPEVALSTVVDVTSASEVDERKEKVGG